MKKKKKKKKERSRYNIDVLENFRDEIGDKHKFVIYIYEKRHIR